MTTPIPKTHSLPPPPSLPLRDKQAASVSDFTKDSGTLPSLHQRRTENGLREPSTENGLREPSTENGLREPSTEHRLRLDIPTTLEYIRDDVHEPIDAFWSTFSVENNSPPLSPPGGSGDGLFLFDQPLEVRFVRF